MGNISTIRTKEAISNTAAICTNSTEFLQEYEESGKNISSLKTYSYGISNNYELKVELENEDFTNMIASETSLKKDGSFLLFNSKDYTEIYTTLQKISAAVTLHKNQNQQV